MKATYYNGRGEVRVTDMPEPTLLRDDDAIVRVTLASICGADLDFFNNGPELGFADGTRIGHEFLGVVEAVGKGVRTVKAGQRVLVPFCFSDGTCFNCRNGLHSSCERGGVFGSPFWGPHADGDVQGGQSELARIPMADSTLIVIPEALSGPEHDAKVLPLGDNFATGYHGAVNTNIRPGDTVVVIGDGAVGQCAVQAATLFSPASILLIGHHDDRLKVATANGATHAVNSNQEDAVAQAKNLTHGRGADAVIDAIGSKDSLTQSFEVARDGATVSALGLQFFFQPVDPPFASAFMRNIRIHTGLCPAPAYIPKLMKLAESGRIDPSTIFTHRLALTDAARGYDIMNSREQGSIKVSLSPSSS